MEGSLSEKCGKILKKLPFFRAATAGLGSI